LHAAAKHGTEQPHEQQREPGLWHRLSPKALHIRSFAAQIVQKSRRHGSNPAIS
jgi:hypothetical protein